MIAIENTLDGSTELHGYRAENLACYFETPDAPNGVSQVDLQLDGESISLLSLGVSRPNVLQVNVKLPASLSRGVHSVRLRTTRSAFSNALNFTYAPDAAWDEPAPA